MLTKRLLVLRASGEQKNGLYGSKMVFSPKLDLKWAPYSKFSCEKKNSVKEKLFPTKNYPK